MEFPKRFVYEAANTWPCILFFGAIHGNEPSGTLALQKLQQQLNQGELTLIKGELHLVPIANPQAYQEKKTFIDANLNRIFCPSLSPRSYEQHLANKLCSFVDKCDVFVDLHSLQAEWQDFLYQDYATPACATLAKSSGVDSVINWWPQLYETIDSYDTLQYAHSKGKACVLYEAWQHDDPQSVDRAYHLIRNILHHYGLILYEQCTPPSNKQTIVMTDIIFKKEEWHFVQPRKQFDVLRKGEAIAVYDSWETLYAPKDCIMIMPSEKTPLGTDRYYLGKKW